MYICRTEAEHSSLGVGRIVCGGAVVPRSPSASPQAFVLLLYRRRKIVSQYHRPFFSLLLLPWWLLVLRRVFSATICYSFSETRRTKAERETCSVKIMQVCLFFFSLFSRWFCCCAISCLVASTIVIGTSIDYIRLRNRNIRSKVEYFH